MTQNQGTDGDIFISNNKLVGNKKFINLVKDMCGE